MNILITGASSMIGTALTLRCIAEGHEVFAFVRGDSRRLDRLPDSPRIHLCKADLTEYAAYDTDGIRCDVCFHLAWGHTVREQRDDPRIQCRSIEGTLDAAALAQRCGCKVFVGAGSQAEFGRVQGIISADTPCAPETAYGMAKYAASMLSRKFCEQNGMKHIWCRIFSVYGSHDGEGTMISYAVERFLRGEAASFSAAKQMWNYLHEDDAAALMLRLAVRDAEPGIYCIAHPESRPLREYIEIIRRESGRETDCSFAPETGEMPVSLHADVRKTLDAAGYVPQVSFDEGIRRIYAEKQTKRRNGHA